MKTQKLSKRVKEAYTKFDQNESYSIKEALELLTKMPKAKFNESIDVAIKLNIDPKNSDQMVRGTVRLPSGTGKDVRVIVFCKGENEAHAKEAGADIVGGTDLIDKVMKGFMDFDSVVATPDMMKDVSRLGKLLGPRGLMPSPKTGTVTQNVKEIIKELKSGKIEFRINKQGALNVSIGRASFSVKDLVINFRAFFEALQQSRPPSVKGEFIASVYISSTMGPGIRIKA